MTNKKRFDKSKKKRSQVLSKKKKPLEIIIGLVLPFLIYFFAWFYLRPPLLDVDGFHYVWFWNNLAGGIKIGLQGTVPKPLLVVLYGILANTGKVAIDALKILSFLFTGLGIFYLSSLFIETSFLSILAEIVGIIMPLTFINALVGNGSFFVIPFILWGLYFYFRDSFLFSAIILFFGGLVRPEVWGIALILNAIYIIRNKRVSFTLLVALLSIPVWTLFDFLISGDPFYSFKVVKYYRLVTGLKPLSLNGVTLKWSESLSHFGGFIFVLVFLGALIYTLVQKENRMALIVLLVELTMIGQLTLSSVQGGVFIDRFGLPVMLLGLVLIFFTIEKLIGNKAFGILFGLTMSLVFFLGGREIIETYKSSFETDNLINGEFANISEDLDQIILKSRKALLPMRRIGYLSYCLKKPLDQNRIITEREFVSRDPDFSKVDFITYVPRDFVGKSGYYFSILQRSDTIRAGRFLLVKELQSRLGEVRVFKVLPLVQEY
ncbi:MAG: hypothetical protein ABIM32_01080 [candidate division WOR-3 bacterium]